MIIKDLKTIANLNITEIAEMLNLPNSMVVDCIKDDWREDFVIDEYYLKTIKKIFDIVRKYEFSTFYLLFIYKDENGKTLKDYIKNKDERIEEFTEILCKKYAEKIKNYKAVKRPVNNEQFSIPVYSN